MRVAIVGPGLIGRSVALAARRADPGVEITEIDRGDSLERAHGADLIVLATPVEAILEIIRRHADILRASPTLDTGSTKRAILTTAAEVGLPMFVGGHPMAGGTSTGPAHARADLFDGRAWFVVPGAASTETVSAVEAFIRGLRAVPVRVDAGEHDRVMAAVSHLPQVAASALAAVAAEAARDRLHWAGNGLRDTTRLAGSSSEVWRSILMTNADELAPLLRELAKRLQTLADGLDRDESVMSFLDEARAARELL